MLPAFLVYLGVAYLMQAEFKYKGRKNFWVRYGWALERRLQRRTGGTAGTIYPANGIFPGNATSVDIYLA